MFGSGLATLPAALGWNKAVLEVPSNPMSLCDPMKEGRLLLEGDQLMLQWRVNDAVKPRITTGQAEQMQLQQDAPMERILTA